MRKFFIPLLLVLLSGCFVQAQSYYDSNTLAITGASTDTVCFGFKITFTNLTNDINITAVVKALAAGDTKAYAFNGTYTPGGSATCQINAAGGSNVANATFGTGIGTSNASANFTNGIIAHNGETWSFITDAAGASRSNPFSGSFSAGRLGNSTKVQYQCSYYTSCITTNMFVLQGLMFTEIIPSFPNMTISVNDVRFNGSVSGFSWNYTTTNITDGGVKNGFCNATSCGITNFAGTLNITVFNVSGGYFTPYNSPVISFVYNVTNSSFNFSSYVNSLNMNLTNNIDGSGISNFCANVSNSTSSQSLCTTNGTARFTGVAGSTTLFWYNVSNGGFLNVTMTIGSFNSTQANFTNSTNSTAVQGYFIGGTNFSSFVSLNAELGTLFVVTANNGVATCIDVNNYRYGVNTTCSLLNASLVLNITGFERSLFNDSRSVTNLSYNKSGLQNNTVYIPANGYDDLDNLSVYVRGYSTNGTFPANVKLYVGTVLSNTIGLLLNTTSNSVVTFNDSLTNKNISFSSPGTMTVGYLHLPKNANVTNTSINITASQSYTIQEAATTVSLSAIMGAGVGTAIYEVYVKPTLATNLSLWQIKIGANSAITTNYSIPQSCWAYNASALYIALYGRYDTDTVKSGSNATCYNGTHYVQVVGVSSSTSGAGFEGYDTPINGYDGDYSTDTHYYHTSVGGGGKDGWTSSDGLSSHNLARIYEDSMFWFASTNDSWVEVGAIDGIREWNSTSGSIMTNFSSQINQYLAQCTADANGYCNVPLTVYSSTGSLLFDNVSINYTFTVNPVYVNTSILSAYLLSHPGNTTIPLLFTNSANGTIEVSNVSYKYAGGNATYTVLAHNPSYTINASANVTFFYSKWDYSLAGSISAIEFIPQTSTSKNVTPYRQTSTVPMINVTSYAYNEQGFNFSIYDTMSFSCVNLTVSKTSNKSLGVLLPNNKWTDLIVNMTPSNSSGLWFWADYNCSAAQWRYWQPNLTFRACATGTNVSCDNSTS